MNKFLIQGELIINGTMLVEYDKLQSLCNQACSVSALQANMSDSKSLHQAHTHQIESAFDSVRGV